MKKILLCLAVFTAAITQTSSKPSLLGALYINSLKNDGKASEVSPKIAANKYIEWNCQTKDPSGEYIITNSAESSTPVSVADFSKELKPEIEKNSIDKYKETLSRIEYLQDFVPANTAEADTYGSHKERQREIKTLLEKLEKFDKLLAANTEIEGLQKKQKELRAIQYPSVTRYVTTAARILKELLLEAIGY